MCNTYYPEINVREIYETTVCLAYNIIINIIIISGII